MTGAEILRAPSTGEAVRDLQHRLAAAGSCRPVTRSASSARDRGRGPRVPGGARDPRRRHRRTRDLVRAGRERLRARRPAALLQAARTSAATTSPSCSTPSTARLRRRARGRHPRAPRPPRALREFQRNTGLTGRRHPRPRDPRGVPAGRALMAGGSVAAVRERDELRRPRRPRRAIASTSRSALGFRPDRRRRRPRALAAPAPR